LKIPFGKAVTYSAVASDIGQPTASRAVGAAIGANPISFVVPCHRAVAKNGALTGYHWGLTRKRAILGWETGNA
jgi:AraC family transcriptional regulator of adaptative response/methylated-DNA-[protein]-cysteine methyltransferase